MPERTTPQACRLPPRRADRPSPRTTAQYYREGRRHLAAAMAAYPAAAPLDALVLAVRARVEAARQAASTPAQQTEDQKSGDPRLRPRSARLYAREHARIVAVLCRAQRQPAGTADAVMATIAPALDELKGRPHEPRTASRKAKDVTEEEARRIFADLKERALDRRDIRAGAAAIFTLIAAHLGPRPVELCGAELDGTVLILPTAKGGAPRPIDLTDLHPTVVEGLRALLMVWPPDNPGFVGWRDMLAERLARACERVGVRRISLYSFRHVAIATWERAGLTPEVIARMAGHASRTTAQRHYARGRHGWKRAALPRPLASEPGARIVIQGATDGAASPSAGAATLDGAALNVTRAEARQAPAGPETTGHAGLRTAEALPETTLPGARAEGARIGDGAEPEDLPQPKPGAPTETEAGRDTTAFVTWRERQLRMVDELRALRPRPAPNPHRHEPLDDGASPGVRPRR